jgi:hypothetical protein
VGEHAQHVGDRHVGPVLLHQAADVGLAATRAEVAADVDGCQVLGDFAEQDGAVEKQAHRGKIDAPARLSRYDARGRHHSRPTIGPIRLVAVTSEAGHVFPTTPTALVYSSFNQTRIFKLARERARLPSKRMLRFCRVPNVPSLDPSPPSTQHPGAGHDPHTQKIPETNSPPDQALTGGFLRSLETIKQSFVDAQYERDPSSAMAEFGAKFRNDIDSYVTRDAIANVTVDGRRELMPMAGTMYVGFVDPSGGSADSMTLAIAHKDRNKDIAVLDCVREVRPPFSPEAVTRDFAAVLKSYRINRVIGDRYAGEWVIEQFKFNGISYEPAEQAKSDIYRDVLPLINSGKVELLDLPKLEAQFVGLERRTAHSGKDSIDRGPGSHDDLVNSAAGALLRAGSYRPMRINPEVIRQMEMENLMRRNSFGRSWVFR